VAAINSVGTFVLFLGKVSVVVSTVFIGIEIMKTQEEPVKYVWAPITLAALFSYMIVDCFIGVYGVSIQGNSVHGRHHFFFKGDVQHWGFWSLF
jgi:solute carrier family 44 protein 1 (choline transporter-like protein)